MSKPWLCLVPLTSPLDLTPTRLRRSGQVGAAAFGTDSLFRWFNPSKVSPQPDPSRSETEFLEGLAVFFERRVRRGVGSCVLAVWEHDGPEGETGEEKREEVVGWAIWKSFGADFSTREQGEADTLPLEPAQVDPDSEPESDIEPKKGSPPDSRSGIFGRVWTVGEEAIHRVLATGTPVTIDYRTLDSEPPQDKAQVFPHVDLTLIAVSPECQGQGIGGALLEWGMRKADALRVPIVMGASPKGARLYRRKGFDDLGIRLVYASDQDVKEYGDLNDNLLVRWPPDSKRVD